MSGVMMLSRDAKRVPLDFDWPQGKTWEGYLSPPARDCPAEDCDNGETIARKWVERAGAILLLAAEAPEKGRLHPWLEEVALHPGVPGPQIREVTGGLAGRPYRSPFGHDAIDRWATTRSILKAAGLDEDWGICPVCKGHAIHPNDQAEQDAWQPTEPPEGPGWQMWESASEGSPISPVFSTAEKLAEWMAAHDTSITSSLTAVDWLEAIGGHVIGTDIATSEPIRSKA